MPRGFILQSTYRIEGGQPAVHIYGKLDSGASFLIRDTRQVPCFYICRADGEQARRMGATLKDDTPPKVNFLGEPVSRVEVRIPQDVPPLRDRLSGAGIACYEADVAFASRYLIDQGIRGSLEIDGASVPGNGVAAVFENPQLRPADWTPELSVLSFDIETDPLARRLLSVSLAGCGTAEVLLLSPRGYSTPPQAQGFATEAELFQAFIRRVRDLDPDILTGWNAVDFDLAVLLRMAERLGIPPILGRGQEPLRLRPSSYGRGSNQAFVQGRVVLDGIQLLRGAFMRLESYSLESAAREILGRGKIIAGPERAQEILQAFKKDRPRFVEYNLNDSRLVLEILDKLHLIELAVERSRLTGMPPDRVAASIASFDFLYLSELSRRRIVAPTVQQAGAPIPTSGGHVLEPRFGLYRNVMVFDFKSLYPSIIRTFQIDPLGHLPSPRTEDDPIVAPNGAAFRRRPGILPLLLDNLFARRESAKAAGDKVASHAIKILMNSFYGVLGTPACRFAAPALANAITGFGRELLLWSKAHMERSGYDVLYGDTDSLFVLSGLDDPEAADRLGMELAAGINRDLAEHIQKTWRVESRLELEFEKLYLRFLLPAARHGAAGARKRYAGLVMEEGRAEVLFTGMEAVRSDWTDLAKRVQRELYLRLFHERPLEEYLRGVVRQIRAGRMDDLLVYRKSMRKDVNAYTASTPPHVAAARKMKDKPGTVIAYVVTVKGPEPAAERRSPIDYEHYVQKQIRAVAEPVLALLGLAFDRVIGDDAQLRLF